MSLSVFEPLPAWLDLGIMLILGTGLIVLWRSVTRHHRERSVLVLELSEVRAEVEEVKEDVEGLERGLEKAQDERHDMNKQIAVLHHEVNAVGHTLQEAATDLSVDIINSEERLRETIQKLIESQGVLLQQISTRPCILNRGPDDCPEE